MFNSLLLHRLSITLSSAITTVTHFLLDDMEKPRRKRGRPRRKRNPPKPPGSPTSILSAQLPLKLRSHQSNPRSLPRPTPLNPRRHAPHASHTPHTPQNTPRRRGNSSWPPPHLPENVATLPHATLRCRLRRSSSPGNRFLTIELPNLPSPSDPSSPPPPVLNPPPAASGRTQHTPLADIQLPQQTLQNQSLLHPPSQMKPIISHSKSYRSALRSIIRDASEPSENTPTSLTPPVRSSRRVRFSHTVQLVY